MTIVLARFVNTQVDRALGREQAGKKLDFTICTGLQHHLYDGTMCYYDILLFVFVSGLSSVPTICSIGC